MKRRRMLSAAPNISNQMDRTIPTGDGPVQLHKQHKDYAITPDNALDIVKAETGKVFAQVLEHCGVYHRTPGGKTDFIRFLEHVI